MFLSKVGGSFFLMGIALVRERIFDGYVDHFRRASEYCKIQEQESGSVMIRI
jgi:hypothetical protein